MLLRLATLVGAQALDLSTFALMVGRHGIGAEANPLAVSMFLGLGMPAMVAGKIALVVAIGALVVAGADRFGRPGSTLVPVASRGVVPATPVAPAVRAGWTWALVRGLPLALAIAAGLIGGITNTANILR